MTDEERKQFINEYCRNVGNIKIRCDDCKFVENCVDYGWQECKKFTPKPSEPMTKLCNSCEYLRYCARSGIEEVGCDRYKRDMTTNEEWLKSLDTEGLVDYLFEVHKGGSSVERQRWIEEHKERIKMQYRGWLKQPHREE